MRLPPSVHVVLAPSRIAGTGIGVLAAATVALTLGIPLRPLLQLLLVVAVVAWVGWVFPAGASRRGRFAVTEVRVAPALGPGGGPGDGRLGAGRPRPRPPRGAVATP